jgi:predicted small secreted protein
MKRMIFRVTPLVLLGVALAGCSATQGNPAEPGTASAGTVTTQEPSGQQIPSNPGTGIIKSTTMTSCDTKEGDVNANGTVTLPQDVEGTVQITVSWTDPKTSSVLAQAVQKVDKAQPGKTTDWKVSAKLGKATTDVKCVLGATVLPAS